MSLGLFLDVDGVLTIEPTNIQIARLLEVHNELEQVEQDFSLAKITSDQFAEKLISLFRNKGFSQKFIDENVNKVTTRIGIKNLLASVPKEDIYFVSSGPSYYVRKLAQIHSIPEDNVLCSIYEFDKWGNGLLSECKVAVTPVTKAEFVKKKISKYSFAIGVGDKKELDSPFLTLCNIKVLFDQFTDHYVSVRDLPTLTSMVENMYRVSKRIIDTDLAVERSFGGLKNSIRQMTEKYDYEKNVFIMAPFRDDDRYAKVVTQIKQALEKHGLHGHLANTSAKEQGLQLNAELWPNVQAHMLGSKYGIVIFTDDIASLTDPNSQIVGSVYNPNVSVELGFMLSRGKNVLVLKEQGLKRLPTDMLGHLYQEFDIDNLENSLSPVVNKWCTSLK